MRSRWMKTSARYAWNGCMKPSITTMCSVGARNSWKNWRRQLNKIDEVPVDRIGPRKNLGLVFSIRRRKRTDSIIVLVDHRDRKSTRLNSSHVKISYAVFCLKKKTK